MSAAILSPRWEAAKPAPGALSGREIVQTRLVSASREAVWAAWTDAQLGAGWWGSEPLMGGIHESVAPVWLVFSSNSAVAGVPVEEVTSVTFVELGGRTHVAVRSELTGESAAAVDVERLGALWRERLDNLVDRLAASPGGAR